LQEELSWNTGRFNLCLIVQLQYADFVDACSHFGYLIVVVAAAQHLEGKTEDFFVAYDASTVTMEKAGAD
jgi:hypothetical protein